MHDVGAMIFEARPKVAAESRGADLEGHRGCLPPHARSSMRVRAAGLRGGGESTQARRWLGCRNETACEAFGTQTLVGRRNGLGDLLPGHETLIRVDQQSLLGTHKHVQDESWVLD